MYKGLPAGRQAPIKLKRNPVAWYTKKSIRKRMPQYFKEGFHLVSSKCSCTGIIAKTFIVYPILVADCRAIYSIPLS